MTKQQEPEERQFLSFDRAFHVPGSTLAEADVELVRAAERGAAETIELPSGFAQSLGLPEDTEFAAPKVVIHEITWVFLQDPNRIQRIYDLTREQAAMVRRLRVKHQYSWRAIAETCHRVWHGDWDPPFNQVIGMGICATAARFFGEDSNEPPWN